MGFNTYPQNPFPPSSEAAGGTEYDLPIASTTELGGVKIGSGLAINAETGVLINNYELPIATPETLGGVKVDTTSGLFVAAGEIGVNIKQNGGLHFDQSTGELFADNWTPPAFTTNETETGEHWVNGKTIYRKTIHFEQQLTAGQDNTIAHDITNLDPNVCFVVNGVAYTSGGNVTLIPTVTTRQQSIIGVPKITSTDIYVSVGSDYSSDWQITEGYITLSYTKATT